MHSCAHLAEPPLVVAMTRQQQERAKIKGAFSAPAVTQAGKDSVKGSQAYLRQPGTCTLLCNSLNGASNIYEHSRICRQSWDGRVYHRPSLLSTASRGQLRHSYTATINKQTAARCYDCWLQSSQAVMESCSKSAEELELVSLLQVLLVSILPDLCPVCIAVCSLCYV